MVPIRLISFPFRLSTNGSVSTIDPGSDEEVQEAITVAVHTRPGERPLWDDFGIPDPAYVGIDAADVQVVLDAYGPEDIEVESVSSEPVSDLQTVVTFEWRRSDDSFE